MQGGPAQPSAVGSDGQAVPWLSTSPAQALAVTPDGRHGRAGGAAGLLQPPRPVLPPWLQALRVPGPSLSGAQGGSCEAAAGHHPPCPAREGDAPCQALRQVGCHRQQLGQVEA